MSCLACPSPATCPGGIYCLWAVSDDPVKRRHVADKLAGVARADVAAAADPVALAESMALMRSMEGCPYRSTRGCGCGGGLCSLRAGQVVTHLDCFDCLRRYG